MIDNREIYNSTIERLKNKGVCVKDEFSVVVSLAKEIGEYREKIDYLKASYRALAEGVKEWDETGCELEETEVSEYETFITIESRRKVSNVEIYFQEE